MSPRQKEIIKLISEEIGDNLLTQSNEEHNPGHDPDRMDDIIKRAKQTTVQLRSIRDNLEYTFTGALRG
jgi:hypothetical protein